MLVFDIFLAPNQRHVSKARHGIYVFMYDFSKYLLMSLQPTRSHWCSYKMSNLWSLVQVWIRLQATHLEPPAKVEG